MRVDPDTCRDPDLLAAEVRRLQTVIIANKSKGYADVIWQPEDIKTLRPSWALERCEDWLQSNEKYIRDRTIELGWEVIETLLGESE